MTEEPPTEKRVTLVIMVEPVGLVLLGVFAAPIITLGIEQGLIGAFCLWTIWWAFLSP